MATKHLPSADELRQLIDYSPGTGCMVWRLRPRSAFTSDRIWKGWNAKNVGKPALNNIDNYGYRRGNLSGHAVKAHIVAWIISTGRPPIGYIDHINHDPSDNRLCNLREVSKRDNHLNMSLSKANTSGIVGVTFVKKRWQAMISVNYKSIYLGRFDTIAEAAEARRIAEREHGFHVNHGT